MMPEIGLLLGLVSVADITREALAVIQEKVPDAAADLLARPEGAD